MIYCDNEPSIDGGVGSTHERPPPICLSYSRCRVIGGELCPNRNHCG